MDRVDIPTMVGENKNMALSVLNYQLYYSESLR